MKNKPTGYSAPWGGLLKAMTLFCAVILLGIPATVLIQTGRVPLPTLLPPAVLIAAAFFMIRGYELRPGRLAVKRLGWESRIDLAGLQSAEFDPSAMSGSIRTFGNGGLFCFAGWFRNKKLGSYRAFATDSARSVVLKFPKRTLVVTPGDPEAFVNALSKNSET
jgi:hypothetical protein